MPAGRMPYGGAGRHAGRPTPSRRARRGHPQLVAQVARVAGAADIDARRRRSSRRGGGSSAGRRTASPVAASSTARARGPWSASAATRSVTSSICDVEAVRVQAQPAQLRIGRRPAPRRLVEAGDGAVVDDLAVLVAPGRVEHLADGDSAGVAGDRRGRRGASRRVRVTRYLKSGETSISAAASRIALYSMSTLSCVDGSPRSSPTSRATRACG